MPSRRCSICPEVLFFKKGSFRKRRLLKKAIPGTLLLFIKNSRRKPQRLSEKSVRKTSGNHREVFGKALFKKLWKTLPFCKKAASGNFYHFFINDLFSKVFQNTLLKATCGEMTCPVLCPANIAVTPAMTPKRGDQLYSIAGAMTQSPDACPRMFWYFPCAL